MVGRHPTPPHPFILQNSVIVYTRNLLKSTMLRPLKGEVGYKLAASKWSKTPAQAPLWLNCEIDLMVLFKVDCLFHTSMADNVIACRSSSVIYPNLPLSPSHFQNSLSSFSIERVNEIPLWDFYASDFQRVLKIIAKLFIVMTISPG